MFAVLSLVCAILSEGFLEADGVTHFLYARHAFESPFLFADVWGRPIVTMLHSVPAQIPGTLFGQPIDLIAVRATSLLLAIGCALVAWRIARADHDRPALAGVFTLASPLVFLHSFSELTELPFAFLSICCLLAYQRRQWVILALVASLLPAARPEGIGFLLMVAGGLLLHRRWLALPLVLVGPVVWAVGGWLLTGRPWAEDGTSFRPMFDVLPAWIAGPIAWLPNSWPYSSESTYDAGPLLKFVGMLPAVVGPGLLPFMLVGIVVCFRDGRRLLADHQIRVRWIAAFIPLFVLTVHSLLHWTGKMASSGDVRYLIAVAPFWGLIAARGFDAAVRWARLPDERALGVAFIAAGPESTVRWARVSLPLACATVLAVLPPLALQLYWPIVPLVMDEDARGAMRIADWYEASAYAQTHPNLRANHPVFWYRLSGNPMNAGTRAVVEAAEPGSILLWHDIYSVYNADERYIVPADMPLRYAWRDETPPDFPQDWKLFTTESMQDTEVGKR